jgi:hypothetical protein
MASYLIPPASFVRGSKTEKNSHQSLRPSNSKGHSSGLECKTGAGEPQRLQHEVSRQWNERKSDPPTALLGRFLSNRVQPLTGNGSSNNFGTAFLLRALFEPATGRSKVAECHRGKSKSRASGTPLAFCTKRQPRFELSFCEEILITDFQRVGMLLAAAARKVNPCRGYEIERRLSCKASIQPLTSPLTIASGRF